MSSSEAFGYAMAFFMTCGGVLMLAYAAFLLRSKK